MNLPYENFKRNYIGNLHNPATMDIDGFALVTGAGSLYMNSVLSVPTDMPVQVAA